MWRCVVVVLIFSILWLLRTFLIWFRNWIWRRHIRMVVQSKYLQNLDVEVAHCLHSFDGIVEIIYHFQNKLSEQCHLDYAQDHLESIFWCCTCPS